MDRSVVTKHLKNVYESGELSENSTRANFAQVADNGKIYQYKFYSLSAIIAVVYRIRAILTVLLPVPRKTADSNGAL